LPFLGLLQREPQTLRADVGERETETGVAAAPQILRLNGADQVLVSIPAIRRRPGWWWPHPSDESEQRKDAHGLADIAG